jgi:hypothetical protein
MRASAARCVSGRDVSTCRSTRTNPSGMMRLQFTEFFNAFNTPQFNRPNGISFTRWIQ